jgi:hypothetical protein
MTTSDNAPLMVLPSGSLSFTATLEQYPGYVFYSDGRIRNTKRGRFLKQDGTTTQGYRTVSLKGLGPKRRTVRVHQLIALAFHGVPAPGMNADHISRDRLDNRASNIRYVTRTENAQNRSPNRVAGSSRFQGVSRHKSSGKYRANIMANGKGHYLGLFQSEEAAALAYQTAKAKYHQIKSVTGPELGDIDAALAAFSQCLQA